MHHTQLVEHKFVEIRGKVFNKLVDDLFVSFADSLVDGHNSMFAETVVNK